MRRVYPVTIAEHESTAVVFGMPKEAIARGTADIIVPLPKIADQILAITSKAGGEDDAQYCSERTAVFASFRSGRGVA